MRTALVIRPFFALGGLDIRDVFGKAGVITRVIVVGFCRGFGLRLGFFGFFAGTSCHFSLHW